MRLVPGQTVSHYRILDVLGEGGMGVVYRAQDLKLPREVALKCLPGGFAGDANARTRFANEARAASSLHHPNLCTIFDIDETPEGDMFIVMPRYEGETLRRRLDGREPIGFAEGAGIVIQLADGLSRAHEKGIVHRDIKPENVFLTSDGSAVLMDFGLAKLVGSTKVTMSGSTVGTMAYMSPEQVSGADIDHRSDTFSLGIVLYELLTGVRPFKGEHLAAIGYAIVNADPAPLVSRRPEVPSGLQRVVDRALAKRPDDRFSNVLEFRDALALAIGVGGAQRASRATPLAGARRRRWILYSAIVLGVVALAAVAVGPLRERFPGTTAPARIESLAVLPLENLSGDPAQDYFTDGITEALITNLGKIGSLRVVARPSVMQYKGTRAPLEEIASELRVQALVAGSVQRSGDRVRVAAQLIDPETERQIWSESYERELRDVLTLQREIAQAIAGELRTKLTPEEAARLAKSRPVDPEAYELLLRARYLGTRTGDVDSREAIALLERAIAIDPGFAPLHAVLAAAYVGRLNFLMPEEARELEQKAYAATETALSLDPDDAEAYLARGNLLWTSSYRFQHERAIQEYRRALSLNPNLDRAHEGLARVFVHLGFFEEAFQHSAKALEINPSNALAPANRAEALLWMGKDEEALAAFSSLPGSAVPAVIEAHVAWALFRLGRREDALAQLRQASHDYPDDASGVLAGAEALLLADSEPRTAIELIGRVEKRKAVGPYHHAAYFAACAYAQMRRPDEAVRWLRECAETGFPCYPLFAHDASLDPIRPDARFQAFLADMQKQSEAFRRSLFPERS